MELLIKAQPGSAAEAIVALPSGGDIMVSAAQGKGFLLERILPEEVDIVLMVRLTDLNDLLVVHIG